MEIGDSVVRKSYGKDITFKIIDIKEGLEGLTYILKGINLRIIADSPVEDLEVVRADYSGETDRVFNREVNSRIKNIMASRFNLRRGYRVSKTVPSKELVFGRPGKILHIDGDAEYLENCLKVYKQLSLEAVGEIVKESDQPKKILEIVKAVKPDIIVLTGHDGIIKDAKDYLDLENYRNSKYFVEAVSELRNYNSSYDELVIFAGACQSCYEKILDAGANFASSPNRVLIHCLDPVFICEKIAYTNVDKVVSIHEVLDNTITGIKGIGGLQTRGKYREGYPKSQYI
ncbi:sporulation peptidase YabG [Clostridium algidicarnis]|uniref:Spore coat assembly protein n=2 Tax=Clostridium algidicarnis TaxID=37659 RepID=A0A2S6FZ70_9CLOT|nr:sporulation peptidase YabG [Clostridium algidicarnis]MBB6631025.1 sporulation peptidase YabG [Clostridium algidicarnis]MBB6698202.1 sporulation peptidase YabG [Clostridium algidicarnis]MBU3194243.1 sporulation peptidase YabG [Clostridium algidicarnis]MBU3197156.1 sporulation peptidase YabG [Clostridium algidicarnis]MBU3203797.1 sporulation peptidase YabG [Clostridium algidicarnis]